MPPRRSSRAPFAQDVDPGPSAARITIAVPTPSRTRRGRLDERARRLPVRQSLALGVRVQEMTLEKRAQTLLDVSGDCLARIINAVLSGEEDDADDADKAWDALQTFQRTYLLPDYSPPFPEVNAVLDALHPSVSADDPLDLLPTALRRSLLVTFLYVVANPDESSNLHLELDDEQLPIPRRGSMKADLELRARVRRRNAVLEMAWKRFWHVVVPTSQRDSESALRLWLDFATQLYLIHRCPTVDPISAPDRTLPPIRAESFLSNSALDQYAVWPEEGEEDLEDFQLRVQKRWKQLVRQRLNLINSRNIDELLLRMPWDTFQQELFAWVEVAVLPTLQFENEEDDSTTSQDGLEDEAVALDHSFASRADAEAADEDLLELNSLPSPRRIDGTDGFDGFDADGDIDMDLLNDIAAEMQQSTSAHRRPASPASPTWAVRNAAAAPLVRPPTPRNFAFGERQEGAERIEWETKGTPARARTSDAVRRERAQDPPSVPRAASRSARPSPRPTQERPASGLAGLVLRAASVFSRQEKDQVEDDDDEDLMPETYQLNGTRPNQPDADHDEDEEDLMPDTLELTGRRPVADGVKESETSDEADQKDEEDEEDLMPSESQLAGRPADANVDPDGLDDESLMPDSFQLAGRPAANPVGSNNTADDEPDIVDAQPVAYDQGVYDMAMDSDKVDPANHANGTARKPAASSDEEQEEDEAEDVNDMPMYEGPDFALPDELEPAPPTHPAPRRRSRSVTFASPSASDDEAEARIRARQRAASPPRRAVAIPATPSPSPPPRRRSYDSDDDDIHLDPYLVDADGSPLEPDETYVLPAMHQAERSALHGQLAGQVSSYTRLSGRARWSKEGALLLYRTVQKVPLSQAYPCRVAWYLHGEYGIVSRELALFNPQHMKDKMRTIVETRDNNRRVIEGRARYWLPPGDERKKACEAEYAAFLLDEQAARQREQAAERERRRRESDEKKRKEAEERQAKGEEHKRGVAELAAKQKADSMAKKRAADEGKARKRAERGAESARKKAEKEAEQAAKRAERDAAREAKKRAQAKEEKGKARSNAKETEAEEAEEVEDVEEEEVEEAEEAAETVEDQDGAGGDDDDGSNDSSYRPGTQPHAEPLTRASQRKRGRPPKTQTTQSVPPTQTTPAKAARKTTQLGPPPSSAPPPTQRREMERDERDERNERDERDEQDEQDDLDELGSDQEGDVGESVSGAGAETAQQLGSAVKGSYADDGDEQDADADGNGAGKDEDSREDAERRVRQAIIRRQVQTGEVSRAK
ncbi:hypothetical protein Q5752_000337 [Cryptotrichosporon argae]